MRTNITNSNWRPKALWSVLGCFALWTSASAGQNETTQTVRVGRTQVYVSDFSVLNATESSDLALSQFVNDMIRYRFAEVDGIVLNRGAGDQNCRGQRRENDATLKATNNRAFYLVRGSMEFHDRTELTAQMAEGGASGLVLNYELLRFVNCTPNVLLSRTEPVGGNRIIESLKIMADTLALRLDREIHRRTQIDVADPVIQGGTDEDFKKELADGIIKALALTPDLQPYDLRKGSPDNPAEYRLESEVRLRRTNVFKLFGTVAEVNLELVVSGEGPDPKSLGISSSYSLTDPALQAPLGQRSDLVKRAGDAAVQGLYDVRQAREAGLPSRLRDMKAANLLHRASELLCEGETEECSPQAGAALPLLQQVLQENPKNEEAREQLAKTLLLLGDFFEAAQEYEELLKNESRASQDTLRLNIGAGYAWLHVQSFATAEKRYDRAADILEQNSGLRSEGDFNIPRSQSHRFAGDRMGALQVLLHPVGDLPEPAVLQQELLNVVDNLSSSELPNAIEEMQKHPNHEMVRLALGKAHEKMGSELVEARKYDEAIQELEQARALTGEKGPPSLSYTLARAQFEKGIQSQNAPKESKNAFRQASTLLMDILKENPAVMGYGPFQMLTNICSDYLDDQACIAEAKQLLKKVDENSIPVGVQMDLLELDVLERKYDAAAEVLNRQLSSKSLSPSYRAMCEFFRTWLAIAEGSSAEARKAFQNWQESLRKARQTERAILWDFGGAKRGLGTGGRSVSERGRVLLLSMIDSMEHFQAPVPGFDL